MFKRRNPRGPLGHARELFWPSMGWRRAFRYVRHRIIRLSDSTHKIAGGLAIGAAVTFSPLIGTHFIQCAVLCYFLRFNILASLVGTALGNPWTLPFIWWISFKLGVLVMQQFGYTGFGELPDINHENFWHIITTYPMQIFAPWMVGGHILAVLVWFPSYILYYGLVKTAREARAKSRLRRVHNVAKEITGQEI
jgi:uncharacterized protein (DUF2062 family)